ncbi:MAG: peptidase M20 [Clostridia bacterium BRH_c25]|nr:MAG: peptidase M20 [Clostridia bacterium BRH_c25]
MSSKYDNVLDLISRDETVRFLQDILRIDSVIRPGKSTFEEEVAVFIADYLRKLGFETLVDEVEPHRPNVVSVLSGREKGRCLLFEGHSDVVTEGVGSKWTYPAFGGEIHNGRLYGRGACDTKGNVAAMIMAARAIKESGVEFKGKIKLCIPVDEEGLMIGIKDFIKKGHADDIDAAIICEPEENNVCIKQKGAMRAVIRIFGKQSHGCMPLTGINPIPKMAKLISHIMELEAEEIGKRGKDPFLGYPSITPTVVLAPSEAEPQVNVVPGELKITIDIRTICGQDHNYIEERLTGLLKAMEKEDKEFKATLEIIEQRPWTETPAKHPIVRTVAKAYKDLTGRDATYNGVPGATDGTFLKAWKGIEIVTTGAGNRELPHQYDEYVDIDELMETSRLYALSALYYLNEEY